MSGFFRGTSAGIPIPTAAPPLIFIERMFLAGPQDQELYDRTHNSFFLESHRNVLCIRGLSPPPRGRVHCCLHFNLQFCLLFSRRFEDLPGPRPEPSSSCILCRAHNSETRPSRDPASSAVRGLPVPSSASSSSWANRADNSACACRSRWTSGVAPGGTSVTAGVRGGSDSPPSSGSLIELANGIPGPRAAIGPRPGLVVGAVRVLNSLK